MTDGPTGRPAWEVRRWSVDRLGDLAQLVADALPDEELLAEDLETCCFDEPPTDLGDGRVGPSVTFGVDDHGRAVGALAVALRHAGGLTTAHVQVVAVDRAARRRGVGRALVSAAEEWARSRGAALLHLGAAAPFYLFTGVDARWTDALCFAEQLGFSTAGVELDLTCPTVSPALATAPSTSVVVEVRPVRSGDDVEDLLAFAGRCYPQWVPELRRGAESGTAFLARTSDGGVVGAAAHSVNRVGVVGPVGVDPGHHGGGVGTALMQAVLVDLSAAGVRNAEIAWTSTVRFYALACGARVGRASLQLNRWL